MFGSIITTCFKARKENFNCPMAATAFVVPFGLFFSHYNNLEVFMDNGVILFTWFAIAFAISQYQGWRKSKNNFEK